MKKLFLALLSALALCALSALAEIVPGELSQIDPENVKPRPKPKCFTGAMKVQTPEGAVRIDQLTVGSEVYSVDLASGRVVKNVIGEMFVTPDQEYGVLSGLEDPIEVTPRHRFFSLTTKEYIAIEAIPPMNALYDVIAELASSGKKLSPVRGQYNFPAGRATVYNLELNAEPHNFIVNGLLVHNGKQRGL